MRRQKNSTGRQAELSASSIRSRPTSRLSYARGLALVVIPGAILCSAYQVSAQEQASTPTIGPEATARGVTVLTRPRPDYDPVGVRLSGFRIDASVEAGAGYDDNLQPGRGEKTRDGFFTESANVSANSFWTRHALGVTASQSTRQYFSTSDQNWNDYAVGISGRYDIGRASSLRASYTHARAHLDVDNFDVQSDGQDEPVPYDTDVFLVGGTAAFNRVTLTGTVDYRTIRYENTDVGGVRVINSNNDYDSLRGELQAGYSIVEGRDLLALVRLEDIRYQESAQRGRDSFTWEVQAGIEYDLTGLWQARMLAGYRERNYDSPLIKNLSGLAFEGQLIYLPSQLTTATLAVSRSIEESIRESSVSYTRTLGRLTVDHELRRNIIVTGELRAEHRDYPQQGNVTDGIALVGAQFLINRHLSVLASYQHTERLSAPEGAREYGINQFQVRLRVAL